MTSLPDELRRLAGPSNAIDVKVELTLFKPSETWPKCRANAAGTKVIYTNQWGMDHTFYPRDWSMEPLKSEAIAALEAQEKPE
jgi:hypothetical protein